MWVLICTLKIQLQLIFVLTGVSPLHPYERLADMQPALAVFSTDHFQHKLEHKPRRLV